MRARPGRRRPPTPSRGEPSPLRESILRWYLRSRRDLPWRRTQDPYAIWVSEIMLQQTRVETVIPYYERFLERFPTVDRLGRSERADVLAAWSGLGYYGRARNLHEAARVVAREYGGRLPEEPHALRGLPGIGAYTAAAIASVAFGRPAAAVDGNVIRVLARIGGLTGRRTDGALRSEIERRAKALAEGRRPGDWTQALMELGATVCLPADPRCDRCPAARMCLAQRSGHPDRYPEAARAPRVRSEARLLLLVRRRGRILLTPDGPHGSERHEEWSLPSTAIRGSANIIARERAARKLATTLGVRARVPEGPVHEFRHRTFSSDVRYEVWCLDAGSAAAPGRGRWVARRDIEDLPVRSPTLKAVRKLEKN